MYADREAKVVTLTIVKLQDTSTVCDIYNLSLSGIQNQNLQFHLRAHNVHYMVGKKDITKVGREKSIHLS